MTNKKLKPRNLGRNLTLGAIVRKNADILCKLILALRSEGVSVPKLHSILQDYAAGNVKKFEKLSGEDMQYITVKRQLPLYGIEFDDLRAFVEKQDIAAFSNEVQRVFAENVAIFFFQINESLGYGKKRFMRLLDIAENIEGNPQKEVEKLLGVTFSGTLPDAEEYETKPQKFSRSECERMRLEMAAVREMQKGTV